MRHCGICHTKTINEDFCNKCLSRKNKARNEIQKRLNEKRLTVKS